MKDNTIFQIIFAVVLSIGIAVFAFFLLTHFTPSNSRGDNLLNFYDQDHHGDIFILGNSYVNEGVNAYIVEDLLYKKHINRSVYVLGIVGETPLHRVVEVDNIIKSRPGMVVIGLGRFNLANSTLTFENTTIETRERMSLFLERKQINERKLTQEEFQPFYNDDQLHLQTPFERFFDNRKFLVYHVHEFFLNLLSDRPLLTANFKDPWQSTKNLSEAEKKEIVGNNKNQYAISEDFNLQKKALLYTIQRFQTENISVIIVVLPINPMISEVMNQSSRDNLSNFLNSTGVPWYDYEREYPSEYFIDTAHLNVAGRTDFSRKVATVVADNLRKGV